MRCEVDCKRLGQVTLNTVALSNHKRRGSKPHVNFTNAVFVLRSFRLCSVRVAFRCGSTSSKTMMKLSCTARTTGLTRPLAKTQFTRTRTWRPQHPVHLTQPETRRNFTVKCQVHLTSLEFAK